MGADRIADQHFLVQLLPGCSVGELRPYLCAQQRRFEKASVTPQSACSSGADSVERLDGGFDLVSGFAQLH
ncbi:hypothetical protein T265_09827 [Opisthorchis viverrini]|uniref:Uncharacterized protein n=1 Tax=Opisthorchis viverrini TaxID=6198 RepID=A0A074Z4F2_OPIVI|nr:hypothetical protein T265_09827 [Opisthorchis viverrini]KER21976.1 hypothetical protein T265_09827 [Opisthorchis viverrini]